jgi:hypothetical protein
MSARFLVLAAPLLLAVPLLLAATACRSSGAYGGPGYAERPPVPVSAVPISAAPEHRPPLASMKTSYPPDHELEVPAVSSDADAGCAPTGAGHEGSGVACEMDGGTI